MARSNLNVDNHLVNFFTKSDNLAWMKVEIENDTFTLKTSGMLSGNLKKDFETMKSSSLSDECSPCYLLFCLHPEHEAQRWVFILFVPENSKVRAKMLFASGKDDLQRNLGHSNFIDTIHISTVFELEFNVVEKCSLFCDPGNPPLTKLETIAKEIEATADYQPFRSKSMTTIPFRFSEDVERSFQQFLAGKGTHILELKLDEEECLDRCRQSLKYLNKETIELKEPRFYLCRNPTSKKTFFVYSCPSESNVRLRIAYASAKQTVIQYLVELDLAVDKFLELSDPTEIESALAVFDSSENRQEGEMVMQMFNRPVKPGRGPRRVLSRSLPGA